MLFNRLHHEDLRELKEEVKMAVIQGIADLLPQIQAAVAGDSPNAALQAELTTAQADLATANAAIAQMKQDEADSVAAVQAALQPAPPPAG